MVEGQHGIFIAQHRQQYLEHDVADEEDGQCDLVGVAIHNTEVLLEACYSRLADVDWKRRGSGQ